MRGAENSEVLWLAFVAVAVILSPIAADTGGWKVKVASPVVSSVETMVWPMKVSPWLPVLFLKNSIVNDRLGVPWSRLARLERQSTPAFATASWASRSTSIAGSASASRSSNEARETGMRSAVACTSTRPPSPLMTTLASTSARESSE